jgi:hypothetical protein
MDVVVSPQLAICDFCQERPADRCHVRLRVTMCPRCVVLVEAATGEKLTDDGEHDLAA